ncbi:MAG: hypothetical protein ACKVJK_17930, partial [Methylophagaceae bacterium]
MFTGTNGSDTFGRPYTAAAARTLLNVENGATADQTAAQILTAIKTVDGSGSGLDADLLDGQQGSYYYQASNPSAYLTASGSITESHRVSGSAFATTGSPGSVLEYQQASGQTDTRLAPSSDWHNTIRMGHGNPYNYYSNTIAARMTGTGVGDLYTQSIHSNTANGWRKIWSSGNDGAGSGLDADLLDGQHGSYYAPASHNHSGVYLPISGKAADSELLDGVNGASYLRSDADDSYTANNLLFPTLSLNIANNNGAGSGNTYFRGDSSHFVFGLTSGNTLYMNYGNSAGAFRTEGTITHNSALVGTTPWGNSNDGSGSGLDADLLDGNHASAFMLAGAAPNTHTHSYLPLAGGTVTGNLQVNGTTTLGNGPSDQTHINDTLYLGATDSGDSHFYFGENSSNWYGDHWYWDSGYEVERYSRYAGTDTLIEKHDTRYTHKVQTNRAYERLAHSTGYQIGSYNSVAANSDKTNPIYTIGDSYRPSDTSVAGMYGIGYAHSNLWGTGSGKTSGWGQYVVEAGAYTQIFSVGGTWSLGEFNRNGNKVWDAGNDGAGSGLDADLLDGQHGSYYAPASSIPSVGNGTLSITTSGSASGSGTFTANQSG